MPPDRPRITYVIDDLGHGGAQRQLYHSVRALERAADLSVVVLSDVVEPYGPRLRELGIPVEVIARRAGFDAGRAISLARRFQVLGTEVAHAFLDASDAYTFLAAHIRGIPAVLSLRSDRIYATGGRARMLGWMLRHAHAVTTNSFAGRAYLLDHVGVREDHVHRVPNIVDVPSARRDPPATPVIGAVGRLVALKRFDAIIDALPGVRREIPGARVVLIGDGPERAGLETLARRNGVADAVEFAGTVDDAATHIGTFACLVVASTFEGLPNTALEALARGVPVVSVPAGDLPRIVKDGVSGVLARDGSPGALAEAIVRALSSSQLQDTAAMEGPRLIAGEFSAARTRECLVALYSRLRSAG